MILEEIITQNKLETDKNLVHSYCDYFYDTVLLPYQSTPITLIEVGINTGDSLLLWNSYFSHVQIYGIDITPCKNNFLSHPNITVLVGNAYTDTIWAHVPDCDIFIDDGSHLLEDQQWAVQHYSHKVKPGGLFVIEDISDPTYLPILDAATPEHLRPYIKHVDLRAIKNRADDILFTISVPLFV